MSSRRRRLTIVRSWLLVAVIAGGCGVVACRGAAPSNESAQSEATPQGATPPVPSAAATGTAENVTLTDIFPAAPARDLVLNTCSSCHAVACVAMGRKTADRWASLKASHAETVTNTGQADYDAIFAYLQEHFNDTAPEPQIPAALLQQGCTPF